MSDFSIERFRQGHREELNYVYALYLKPVCMFAYQLVGSDSEDITLESFVKLWSSRHKLEGLGHIKGFLYITTRNACIDRLRKLQRERIAYLEFLYQQDFICYINEFNGTKALLVRLSEAIEILPPQCKEVFILTFINGLNTSEVAEKMNIGKQNVLNQKARAIKKIRIFMSKKKL